MSDPEAFPHDGLDREPTDQSTYGYLEDPETDEELGWVEVASQEVLAEYPWQAETDRS